jgi:hypothetical protein
LSARIRISFDSVRLAVRDVRSHLAWPDRWLVHNLQRYHFGWSLIFVCWLGAVQAQRDGERDHLYLLGWCEGRALACLLAFLTLMASIGSVTFWFCSSVANSIAGSCANPTGGLSLLHFSVDVPWLTCGVVLLRCAADSFLVTLTAYLSIPSSRSLKFNYGLVCGPLRVAVRGAVSGESVQW